MTGERSTPLRERMIEDMRIRGMGDKAQKAHIRAVKDFAIFLGHPPDTASPEELRAYQLHMTDTVVTPATFNARIVALRFFFGMTCGREEMKRYMQFRTQPRRLPVVFSVEEVSDILMAAPGPGLKYRAALSISYGAGLRAAEVCNLKIGDIDSDRMLIHVEQGKGRKDRKVMLSPGLLSLLRDYGIASVEPIALEPPFRLPVSRLHRVLDGFFGSFRRTFRCGTHRVSCPQCHQGGWFRDTAANLLIGEVFSKCDRT
ncbi:tyrosine-type recombinase/integrase [Leisingera aquaemixtae]|uniref:Tyrosine recombinase XerC n=1 Tax=Leisingera aquaemixtae TaxID=1396826 RepID=A0A0N7M4B6_9RHOB|nr:site-specific integrase [Leisingera aquaemixtae]CUH99178.1 Tyrosine recombinase XerC [Leisingera aquaemixtae]